jgi:hypothetical protein
VNLLLDFNVEPSSIRSAPGLSLLCECIQMSKEKDAMWYNKMLIVDANSMYSNRNAIRQVEDSLWE